MKKNNLEKVTVFSIGLISSLIIFNSCKMSQNIKNEDSVARVDTIVFSKERAFTQSELFIGRRICSALKSKRQFFQSLYDRQEQVRFQGTLTNCDGKITMDTPFIATILNASSLEYSALYPRENYFRDITTDQSAAMNDLCVSLSASDNVLNTVNVGLVRYSINFLISDNFDRFDVKKEISDSNGVYSTSGAESISIITRANQAAEKFIGVEKERNRFSSCGNNKFQKLKQTWLEALTKF